MTVFLPPELWAVVLYFGQMMDAFTTRYGLTRYGGQELNPIGKAILGRWGFPGLQVLKSMLAGALFSVIGFIAKMEWLWLAMTVLSWFPVVWNFVVILKARGKS